MRIVIADSAVSQVPESWLHDRKIKAYSKKYGRLPLCDASVHQHLLHNIAPTQRKDRPDILHFGLLTILGYQDIIPDMKTYFQIQSDYYQIKAGTHLPRSQRRFYGILEQLLSDPSSQPHINIHQEFELGEDAIYFSSKGRSIRQDDLKHSTFVFGGFAHGDYKTHDPDPSLVVSLSKFPLDLWTAISTFLNRTILTSSVF